MDQAVHAPDYLRDLKADRLVELRAEVIEPIRAKAVAHPLIVEEAAAPFRPVASLSRAWTCWVFT